MSLAYVRTTERGQTDRLLWQFADHLQVCGFKLAGVVQTNSDRPQKSGAPSHHCDMDVRVLPGGPVIRINQVLGEEARGCRLNPQALEQAVALVEGALDAGTDLLIINKFGKHEAEGRGFRPLIAEAMSRGIPVLLGVNALNLEAFEAFAGDFAQELTPEIPALAGWLASLAEKAA